jgi:arylsulfatase A-like enzyme
MNFLVIVSDTLRRDHLGCYGNPWIRTPYLDRFAADALVFDNAYIASFGTVPARRDIFTGRYTATYSVWAPLPRDEVVLADVLGRNGYMSMMVADTPHILENGYHYDRGFTGWEWIRGQESDRWRTDPDMPAFPASLDKLRSPEILKLHLRNTQDWKLEEDHFAPRTMTEASRWLERNYGSRRPWLLYVDTFDPHEPWDAPKWYVDMYDPGYEGEEITYPLYQPVGFLSEPELRHVRAMYAGNVTMVDRAVGRLLQRLEDTGKLDDTCVIFTSDHGFLHGEHGHMGKSKITDKGLSAVPLYEEIASIPMIVRLPGGARGRTGAMVQLPDVMPTLLELAGVQSPPTVQARSFADVLRGETGSAGDMTISMPFMVVGGYAGVRITARADNWAFICTGRALDFADVGNVETYLIDGMRKGLEPVENTVDELYDIAADPKQEVNLAEQKPEVAAAMRKEIQKRLAAYGTDPAIVSCWDYAPERAAVGAR